LRGAKARTAVKPKFHASLSFQTTSEVPIYSHHSLKLEVGENPRTGLFQDFAVRHRIFKTLAREVQTYVMQNQDFARKRLGVGG